MTFDCSRFPFDPWNDYFGVVLQQGRVQLDSDWNECLSELARRIQAGTMDIVGRAVVPSHHALTASRSMHQWIEWPAARLRSVRAQCTWTAYWPRTTDCLHRCNGIPRWRSCPAPPRVPPRSRWTSRNSHTTQVPHFPPATARSSAYLDVWRRPVTYLNDPSLVEVAVGVDTTGRMQTVWQVNSGRM